MSIYVSIANEFSFKSFDFLCKYPLTRTECFDKFLQFLLTLGPGNFSCITFEWSEIMHGNYLGTFSADLGLMNKKVLIFT